jgi:predicted phage terminase large subunit-like protein
MAAYGARLELARREFWSYAQLFAPGFYTDERKFLKGLCDEFQGFMASDYDVFIANLPPRHGKSRTASLFTEWLLGGDPSMKVMIGTYNELLSTAFSKTVRDAISEAKASPSVPVFGEVFPGVAVKRGDAAANLWSLEGQYSTYLATSPGGTATGFGCQLMILDDLIKNSEEALNDGVLEKHWEWFANTMLQRLEEGGKILVIMTRWSSGDLSGRILANAGEYGWRVKHCTLKAMLPDGSMLCPDILSEASYRAKTRAMGADIASANYQQEPLDLKGRLYSSFRTYDRLPASDGGESLMEGVRNYTDTADEGADYLCAIDYGVYGGSAYVIDVLYTREPMEATEPRQAAMMDRDGVDVADVESNNGGRGYARALQRLLDGMGNRRASVHWFHQSKNKRARILSNATLVMERVLFPANWADRWPEFYKAMRSYVRDGKNAHDDAPDAVTGIAERLARHGGVSVLEPLEQAEGGMDGWQ